MKVSLHARPSELRCAICHDALAAGAVCPRCAARFHEDCRTHLTRCPSLGCAPAPLRIERDESPPRRGPTILTFLGVLGVIGLCALLSIPNLSSARKHGNEASAIGALKTIATSEAIYRERNPALEYGSLAQLSSDRLVDSVLGSGTKLGYSFEACPGAADRQKLWSATANPVHAPDTGTRSFATNQNGVIFYTSERALSIDREHALLAPDLRPIGH